MVFIDGTVVNVALPVLRQKLGATVAEAQWIVEAYMLFLASLLLVGGTLGDRWGRRFTFGTGHGDLCGGLRGVRCGDERAVPYCGARRAGHRSGVARAWQSCA